jgi:hypothetical protein
VQHGQALNAYQIESNRGDEKMKASYAVLTVLVFAAGAFAQDWPGNFRGMAEIRLDSGETYHSAVVSQSLDANEWKVIFASDRLANWNRETWTTIGVHTGGKIIAIVAGWGILTITPAEKSVREQLQQSIGVFDSRRQTCTVVELAGGESEMTIVPVKNSP